MKIFLTCFICFSLANCIGQHKLNQFFYSDYIPSELNSPSSEQIKIRTDQYRQAFKDNPLSDEEINSFALNQTFFFQKLNRSGKIFYDNEISTYLNGLKDYLMDGNPKKDFIRVYLVDFPQLNAFTNDFGNIYINVGTIAKLQNEAQLLAVIAHEISHILLRHSLKEKIYFDSLSYQTLKDDYKELETHTFSQKNELEADSLGFSLLISRGIDLTGLEDLFSLLDQNANPIRSGYTDFCEFLSTNSVEYDYLNSILEKNRQLFDFSKLNVKDSGEISTHPAAKIRKERFLAFGWQRSDDIPYYSSDQFYDIQFLAEILFVNTLIHNEHYIDALYLIKELLKDKNHELYQDYLLKEKAKLMLLITQQKYQLKIQDYIINNHANECIDPHFLEFRALVLSISPLEMNILTCNAINNCRKLAGNPYKTRLINFSYQFLYRNNPHFFISSGGNIIPADSIRTFKWNKVSVYQTEANVDYMKSLEKKGFKFVDKYISSEIMTTLFFDSLSSNIGQLALLNEAASDYRNKRWDYESTLTLYDLPIHVNPLVARKKQKHSSFITRKNIADTARLTLLDFSGICFEGKNRQITGIDLQATYAFETALQHSLGSSRYFFQNLSGENIHTIKENYLHNCLMIWIQQLYGTNELVYSSVDEEIYTMLNITGSDYFVFNVNFLLKNRKKGKKQSGIFYTIFIDTNSGGVTAVNSVLYGGKISNKKSLNYAMNLSFHNHVY